ncbi:DUF4232 domain-containing protein [Amycolatopsis pigmentata]|uniref:DUF4232 domain-containing protein n=1 Tax=Amycolatopsis pigmentata TaxID=450801 RepID=A0ABW5FU85_9PSEU
MNINGTVVRRGAVTAFAVAAMAAALGACSTGQTGAAAPGAQAPAPAAGSAADQGSPQAGMRDLSATNGQDGGGVAHAGNEIPCTRLKVTTSQPKAVNDTSTQWVFPIMLTNTGDANCQVRGFPGVRLNGSDGTTWDLTRTSKPITPVVLRPGEHADADLTYLTDDSGNGWKISSMAVTPPNTTDTQVVTWAVGRAIVKQDAATHPGTYIDPVRPGPK